MNKFKIGQIFRYPKDKERDKPEIDGYPNFSFYTDLPSKNLASKVAGHLIRKSVTNYKEGWITIGSGDPEEILFK